MKQALALAAGVAVALVVAVSPTPGAGDDTISMSVRPTVLRYGEMATATGVIPNADNRQVTIETQPCDQRSWRELAATTTQPGGGWSVDFQPGISGLVRAVSAGALTSAVRVQQRPWMHIEQRPARSFFVGAIAERPLWHRKVAVERFDRASRAWRRVKTVLLAHTRADPGDVRIWSYSDHFALGVPRGTTLRARLPLDQARPCYVGATSTLVRA
jgi:hypothetical protein